MARAPVKAAADRRSDLLDAGERVFAKRGVAASTVAEVAEAAGVAKGTFYLYFDSKEDLLAALQDRFTEAGLERIGAAVAACAPGDWAGRLDAYVDQFLRLYVGQGDLHDVLFHHTGGAGTHSGSGRQARAKIVASIAELLRAGPSSGPAAIDNPAQTAELIYATLHGAADNVLHDTGEGISQAITAAQQFVRKAVGASTRDT